MWALQFSGVYVLGGPQVYIVKIGLILAKLKKIYLQVKQLSKKGEREAKN